MSERFTTRVGLFSFIGCLQFPRIAFGGDSVFPINELQEPVSVILNERSFDLFKDAFIRFNSLDVV